MNNNIRFVTTNDTKDILDIYSYYVLNTAFTFEDKLPTIDSFADRIDSISKVYPYLVYEVNGKVVAYAYASKHRERACYKYTVEVSIYTSETYFGKNIASKLYTCLFDILKQQGYYTAYAACVHLNKRSINFHKKFGFNLAGTFHNAGYKFNTWLHLIWLEKNINDYNTNPSEIKPLSHVTLNF